MLVQEAARSCVNVVNRIAFWFARSCLSESDAVRTYDLHGEINDRFCEEQIAVIVLLAPRHTNAYTLCGYGRQWYSTSGADSGGGLMPNLTAWKPWRS